MKKGLLILVMIALCGIYFVSMQNRGAKIVRKSQGISVEEKLKKAQEEIVGKDFSSPTDIIEMNNELMKIFYSSYSADEDISTYVETIRMLYTNELKVLNEKAEQEAELRRERALHDSKPLVLLSSEIKETQLKGNQNGDASKEALNTEGIVSVLHYTNKQDINRDYFIQKEDSEWKIAGWEDRVDNIEEKQVEE
ncbi:hypothetical protein CS063_05705 [Sporanaerobium hydrogeniformans]|uniref:Uncharacterized protein n=1 Tax=Sporanaerobium hydrogeniformans TaxID=3072179 RepID=A0AC61DE71_9FIRM|nr:hypothetical protein [Sporanaerobium hydrogeniformans]PHV71187.1 hypothetical protein CS063_05705 [Sporanaerobium hydrogeniformans]